MKRLAIWSMIPAALLLSACGSTANVGSTADREMLSSRAQAALADFRTADPSLQDLMNKAHAYAIFPEIVSAAVGVGGAHGDGEVYQGGRLIGYADVSQANIGAQLGGQKFSELIIFESQSSLLDFQNGSVELDARATAVAASRGAASSANYQNGVIVFSLPRSGLMAQAAIGGQKFRYRPVGQ
jgi:lipid-binding SYLF domain-containing protein